MSAGNRQLRSGVALVTGGSRNIGAAISRRLGAEGIAVAVNFRSERAGDAAEEVIAAITAVGGTGRAYYADVSKQDEVNAMVRRIEKDLGAPTILVNNAAETVAGTTRWADLRADDWDRVLRANVTGGFICAQAVIPGMRRDGDGVIVNISSIGALRVVQGGPIGAHPCAGYRARAVRDPR
jgi:3-oxoacyl-[acyl-carrier protein] reductase